MSDKIWFCNVVGESSLSTGFQLPKDVNGTSMQDPKYIRLADAMKRNQHGEPLPADRFPPKMCWMWPYTTNRKFRPFTHNGFMMVERRVADILAAHDMGQGNFYPLDLYEHDEVTKVDADYVYLNIGNAQKTVDIEASKGMRRTASTNLHEYYMPLALGKMKKADVVLCADISTTPDIWINPTIAHSIFMSDRLAITQI